MTEAQLRLFYERVMALPRYDEDYDEGGYLGMARTEQVWNGPGEWIRATDLQRILGESR